MTAARAGVRHEGLVVACRRRRFEVRLDDGKTVDCVLKGRATTLACGDRVTVASVAGGGAIEAVAERRSLVYRSDAFREKLVAANVTLICGVVAPGITVDLELVHRWTIAAEAEGCAFALAANKADLPEFPALRARLEPFARLGYPIVDLSAKRDAAPLLPWLAGAHTVLVGQSGMGKSTILNALAPEAVAEDRRSVRGARDRPAHDVAFDAAPAAGGARRRVDRRFARHEGIRPRARRAGRICRARSWKSDHSSVSAASAIAGTSASPDARCARPSTRDSSLRIGSRSCTSWSPPALSLARRGARVRR